MDLEQLLETIRSYEDALELAPGPGSAFPEIAWGDHFFYYSPSGQVPEREQPYATIVTKNYPDDTSSDLDDPDRWRLNIHVGTAALDELTELTELRGDNPLDHAASDVVVPHPVYRAQGWVSIVNPGTNTSELAVDLLRRAHGDAKRRAERRASS